MRYVATTDSSTDSSHLKMSQWVSSKKFFFCLFKMSLSESYSWLLCWKKVCLSKYIFSHKKKTIKKTKQNKNTWPIYIFFFCTSFVGLHRNPTFKMEQIDFPYFYGCFWCFLQEKLPKNMILFKSKILFSITESTKIH